MVTFEICLPTEDFIKLTGIAIRNRRPVKWQLELIVERMLARDGVAETGATEAAAAAAPMTEVTPAESR